MFAHGFAHMTVAQEWPMATSLQMDTVTTATFSILLAIGPVSLAHGLVRCGVAKSRAAVAFLFTESLLVAIFFKFFKRVNYSLLYLNVTISLCVHAPRLLLVGASAPDHVAMRVGDERFFLAKSVSGGSVTGLLVAEPFLCEMGFSSAGGHLLFDVALFSCSLVDILSTPPRTRAKGGYSRRAD